MEIIVLLHNIRSEHNVGSIFRTSDGAGVSKILLSGYTPHPFDRFGRVSRKIQKTSLGAVDLVPYEVLTRPKERLLGLKEEGYKIVAVEQTSTACDYRSFVVPDKVVYIFGNEVEGVDAELLSIADNIIMIPMLGRKESLNVSVCAGVILFGARSV